MQPHSESESSLRTTLLYTNMTAKTVHQALVQKGWPEQSLPSVRTISNLLTAKITDCVQWSNPRFKKTDETDAIFENVRGLNALADLNEHTVRISIDTKAMVHAVDCSKGGRSRAVEAVKALDHALDGLRFTDSRHAGDI
jgi:hypothetical protein